MANLYLLFKARKTQKKSLLVRNIHDLTTKTEKVAIPHFLVVHARSRCVTASATFGQGKTSLLDKLNESEELKDLSVLMNN